MRGIGIGINMRNRFGSSVDPLAAYIASLTPKLSVDGIGSGRFFTDTGATIPASIGDSVASWLDNGSLLTNPQQATSGSRPVLQQDANGNYYLAFNGTSKYFDVGTAAQWAFLNNGSPHTMVVVFKPNVLDSSNDMVLNTFSGSGTRTGFLFTINISSAGRVDAIMGAAATGYIYENLSGASYLSTNLCWLAEIGKYDVVAANRSVISKNNANAFQNNTTSTGVPDTGAPQFTLRIGAAGPTPSSFSNSNLYGIYLFDYALSPPQLTQLDTLLKSKYLIT